MLKFFSGGAHHPTYCPSPASEASHKNFPCLAKEKREEKEEKGAGERSEARKFGVFGRKTVPK